jgi:hypothetical protein
MGDAPRERARAGTPVGRTHARYGNVHPTAWCVLLPAFALNVAWKLTACTAFILYQVFVADFGEREHIFSPVRLPMHDVLFALY